jgi:hypothetical protein
MKKGLLIGGILLVTVFVFAVIVMGIILAVENGIYCAGPPSIRNVTNATGNTMKLFTKSSLFPFNGQQDDLQTGKTATQCIDICAGNTRCQGFYIHTDQDLPTNQGACYFYYGNNAQAMVGPTVNLPAYFTAGHMLVGAQQPVTVTDVYLKTTAAYNVFRSVYDTPTAANIG